MIAPYDSSGNYFRRQPDRDSSETTSGNSTPQLLAEAVELLRTLEPGTPLSSIASLYAARLESGKAVTSLEWETLRVYCTLAPCSQSTQSVLSFVAKFYSVEPVDLAFLTPPLKIDGLTQPFIATLELFRRNASRVAHLRQPIPEQKLMASELTAPILAEHLKTFRRELLGLNAQIKSTPVQAHDVSLKALRNVIQYRAVLADYQIGALQVSGDTATEQTAEKMFHADFADYCYSRALKSPRLPVQFSSHLIGTPSVLPDLILPTLAALDIELRAAHLHDFHIRFLEIMRNAGDKILAIGLPTMFKQIRAVALFDHSKAVEIVAMRNSDLCRLAGQIENSDFSSSSEEGKHLRLLIQILVDTGVLFIEAAQVKSSSINKDVNREIDTKIAMVTQLMSEPSCPEYVRIFFSLCCRNRFPKIVQ